MIQTLLADLVQQLSTSPPAGSVYERVSDGSRYFYAKQQVGARRADIFIDRTDDPAARDRAEQLRQGMVLAKERRSLIGLLKKQRLAKPTGALGAVLDAVGKAGLFADGAVLAGTAAYRLYEPLVGCRMPAPSEIPEVEPAATFVVAGDIPEGLEGILRRAAVSFVSVPQTDTAAASSRFCDVDGFLVEFVKTTRNIDDESLASKSSAAAEIGTLQQLAWLIHQPVQTVALWGSGILVRVPEPARFAVYKLILAHGRKASERMKRENDLEQAQALITALAKHDPYAIEDALTDAQGQSEGKWIEPIDRSLEELGYGQRSVTFKRK